MKNILVAAIGIILLAGCSKPFKQDLTGNWFVYKVTLFSVQQGSGADSIMDDSITFASNGTYTNINIKDSAGTGIIIRGSGRWRFQDDNGQLVLCDSVNVPRDTFTILNLTGVTVELLRNGYDHYLRKNQ
jgi:hypothetical protein